jgi:glycosyltransferase involved in cell wall biosynthesis
MHLVLSLEIGGLERLVVDLAREGRRQGQRVTVACVEARGRLAPELEALGIPVLCVDKPPGLRPRTVLSLGGLMRRSRPDVVHSHQIAALLYGGLPARALGIPVVHTEHGKHYVGSDTRLWVGRAAGWQAARFLCVSREIAEGVRALRVAPPARIGVVANGVDLTRPAPGAQETEALRAALRIPDGAPVVGTVGRLAEIKRQDLLLRGFARLRERLPDCHLVLVGDGVAGGELGRLAEELGQGAHVHFAGYQAQPERYLALMDVFALTSRSEGMPVAVLEAWAARVPVVAARVGGLPEMIESGRNGLLFDFGDEAGLVSLLETCLRDRAAADRLRSAARADVEARYSLAATVQTYARVYEAVRRRPPRGAR